MPPPDGLDIRPVNEGDTEALVGLVGSVYAEYPGCVLDLDGVDADLTAPRATFDEKGGDLWVLEDADRELVACCGWSPAEPGAIELKRLYVRADARGRGIGAWLVGQVEQVARERGARRVVLWSDTRFAAAHRLYERLGYQPTGETRELDDPSDTTEYRFERHVVDDA